jgi:hypothetical protein
MYIKVYTYVHTRIRSNDANTTIETAAGRYTISKFSNGYSIID